MRSAVAATLVALAASSSSAQGLRSDLDTTSALSEVFNAPLELRQEPTWSTLNHTARVGLENRIRSSSSTLRGARDGLLLGAGGGALFALAMHSWCQQNPYECDTPSMGYPAFYALSIGSFGALGLGLGAVAGSTKGDRYESPLTAPRRNPVSDDFAAAVGCTREDLDARWNAQRFATVQVGDDLCVALGRWGMPSSLSQNESVVGESLVLQWGQGGYPYSLTLGATRHRQAYAQYGSTTRFIIQNVTRSS